MVLACRLWSELAWEAPLGLSIPDGCRANGFGFPDGAGAGGLVLLDSCRAEGLSIQGGIGADGSAFFDRLCCLGIILMKFHAQFPDYFLPMGIDG